MKAVFGTLFLFGLIGFSVACLTKPESPTRDELVQINQKLSAENIQLKADNDTYKNDVECGAH